VPAGDAAALAGAVRLALGARHAAGTLVSPTADWSFSAASVTKIIAGLRGTRRGAESLPSGSTGGFQTVPLRPDVAGPGRT
jgi:hypothetical protein